MAKKKGLNQLKCQALSYLWSHTQLFSQLAYTCSQSNVLKRRQNFVHAQLGNDLSSFRRVILVKFSQTFGFVLMRISKAVISVSSHVIFLVFSFPNLAPADSIFKIQNGRHKTKDALIAGKTFYSPSNLM